MKLPSSSSRSLFTLFKNPYFILGLVIKGLLAFYITSVASEDWYVPFLQSSIDHFTLDPWKEWLSNGGILEAFPYGYVMWIVFLPLVFCFNVLGISLTLAYNFTLLVVDFFVLQVLRKLFPESHKSLVILYWLSPIVILATYLYGFNDLVPLFFLLMGIYFARVLKFKISGIFCVLAVSAKLSMVIALPFFFIWLFHNKALRSFVGQFTRNLIVTSLVVGLPYFFSDSAMSMLLNNPEMDKIYQLVIPIAERINIYVVFLIYFIILYTIWKVRRLNFELFFAALGIMFLAFVLLTPSSPGWYIWFMPFLLPYQMKSDFNTKFIVILFSIFYAFNYGIFSKDPVIQSVLSLFYDVNSAFAFGTEKQANLSYTLLFSTGVLIFINYGYNTFSRSDFFRLSKKPFAIGIAGDSGTGKSTFAEALEGLFGRHSVVKISGDDYHLWDRQKSMWKVLTHLNPFANDLEGFARDLISLRNRKSIVSRHYNHQTGKMTSPSLIKSNDIIIASGLHALYLPLLRKCYDLSIYLDMNENLRRHFKIKRDKEERGYTEERVLSSLKKREFDSNHFIQPQAQHAELHLSLQLVSPEALKSKHEKSSNIHFRLLVHYSNALNELSIIRTLVGVCGLHVDVTMAEGASSVKLMIEGETSSEDVALASEILCPKILDFLDVKPQWKGGVLGIMQLITLTHIEQKLSAKLAF